MGYQKLVNVTDNTYTFIDLEGKVKKYEGYTSMDDFYYDVGDDVLKVNCACAREDPLGCSVPEDDIPIVEQYFDFA